MTVRNVNGGSIPAAITASAPGDTLELGSFTYPGFRNHKLLHFRGTPTIEGTYVSDASRPGNVVVHAPGASGSSMVGDFTVRGAVRRHGANVSVEAGVNDVTLDGLLTEEGESGYGIRAYHCDRLTVRRWRARHVAFGAQMVGRNSGTVIEDFALEDIDHMLVADSLSGNDTGATGMDFSRTVGPVLVRRGTIERCRALSPDYGYDGGAFSVYGGARKVTVEDVDIRDALNVLEDGKGSSDPDNGEFVLRRLRAYGRPGALGSSKATQCQGILLRAMQGFAMEDFWLEDLDGFGNFLLSKDGSYAGGLAGVSLRGTILLKSGALAYNFNSNVPLSAATLADVVLYRDASRMIAAAAGRGQTNSLATFRSWGAQAAAEVWRAQETDAEVIARLTAEREQALAALAQSQAALEAMEDARDAAADAAARYSGKLDRIDGIYHE